MSSKWFARIEETTNTFKALKCHIDSTLFYQRYTGGIQNNKWIQSFFTFLIKYTNKALLDLFSLALHAQSRLMRYQERTGQCLAILPPTHPSGTRISAPRVSLYSTDLLVLSAFPCHFLLPFNKELQSSITSWQRNCYIRTIHLDIFES